MTAAQQPGTVGTGADLLEVGTEVVREGAREVLAPAPWAPERSGAGDEGLRITAVRTFLTGPQGCPYVVVRVETNQPGLYGLGDGSDPQRPLATRTVIDEYLGPMLVGRDPSDIEDLHRLLLNSGYWRGGSIEHNALAAVDVALWDLKGKVAGLPVHQLLGGKARAYADAYTHVDGADAAEVAEKVLAAVDRGYRHVRVQVAVPGRDTYGTAPRDEAEAARRRARTDRWDTLAYLRHVPGILADVRDRVGPDVELLHDAHERMTPAEARQFVRAVEDAHLYFLEDALAPEDAAHFPELRAAGTTPLAVGELYHDPRAYLPLVAGRSIDFARLRIPTLGGLTPTRKLVAVCEMFGVRTAPHGPGDVTPVGMAANMALNISSPAFGVQEAAAFRDATLEVFPGAPVPTDGHLLAPEAPGLGVDFDEAAARKYPVGAPLEHDRWALLRATDGSAHRA
ncbi:mandelate racemase [Cellulosimicrobium funkei]|uniref:Mandelate racemase n=1 Tax=Cellulosimicrobium funkei TaxID=264251 RepID=A0A0H2KJN9_9MICO|nr:enolase C-terminal domain-like protein [Cellulosimicrobium funkei]KLN33393.1 mandelate racemase [Cellulosimicrobium funkei]